MAKFPIQLVTDIVKKARGEVKKTFSKSSYEAICLEGQLFLYHYGTLILQYNFAERKVVTTGGAYSASDSFAINSALYEIGAMHVTVRRKQKEFIVEYKQPETAAK